ncbi:hypothetical protein CMI37_28210 [Candidatus Pacearchaeota archaeon]|nr:hypothetical protein [Candidatus Pacearchaeota archaeon]|tara:strand:- start:1712 stop:1987 length:276 start_codon:yes stop_codon:yes gene_type:complete
MTAREMIELVQQHHPDMGEKEIINLLNRAKDDFCLRTEMIKDTYTTTTEANQRYYTLDNKVIKIRSLWLNDVEIPRLSGKPIIDDDTEESG